MFGWLKNKVIRAIRNEVAVQLRNPESGAKIADQVVTQISDKLQQNCDITAIVREYVSSVTSPSTLVSEAVANISYEKVAANLDFLELAQHFWTKDFAKQVSEEIMVSDIAAEVDMDTLAESIADKIDASDVAEYVDTSDIAEHVLEGLDTDAIADKVTDSIDVDMSDLAQQIDLHDLALHVKDEVKWAEVCQLDYKKLDYAQLAMELLRQLNAKAGE